MELQASLPWIALTMTPGIAARLSARLLRQCGSPDSVFRASLTNLEACNLSAPVAQAIFKKQTFWRAEKEVDAAPRVGCKLVNWTEPEYPQSLLQIYDPPVVLYVRGDASILNAPSLAIVGTRRPTVYGTQMADRMGRDLDSRGLAIQRIVDYGAAGDGIWQGSVRRAGECDAGSQLCAEPVNQAGSETGDECRRCDRRAADPDPGGFGAGWNQWKRNSGICWSSTG